MSLGSVTNATRLGQPLDFSVAVKLDPEEALPTQCVTASVLAGDRRLPASAVRTRFLRSGQSTDATIHVSTTTRLDEPVITVSVSLGCPPQLTHRFVNLLDPPAPVLRPTAAALPAREPVAELAPTAATAAPPAKASEVAAPASPVESLQQIEERLKRQQQEQLATQQAVDALQARLREAERARRTDPAIYGLVTLVVLLLGTIVFLLWRLWRLQSRRLWEQEARVIAAEGATPSQSQRVGSVTPPVDEATLTSMRVLTEPTRSGDDNPIAARDATTMPAAARVRRRLTAEEVIDLEQQADFFIALGQEDSAIDLLMNHVRSSGGTSPMPYLKLLEIYRRRSDGDAYERIRERFNRRFNGNAPAWDAPPQARRLDGYPKVMARVQAAWADPARALEFIEALLFRRDASDETFELPAYEDLLFLYAVVRDVVENAHGPEGVDLLLPIGEDEHVSHITHAEVTRPPESWMQQASRPVDLEIDIVPPRRER